MKRRKIGYNGPRNQLDEASRKAKAKKNRPATAKELTHAEFASQDPNFIRASAKLGDLIEAGQINKAGLTQGISTRRQASKYRRNRGLTHQALQTL
jgi:carbamate kinase